jgi:hypothetical protein
MTPPSPLAEEVVQQHPELESLNSLSALWDSIKIPALLAGTALLAAFVLGGGTSDPPD